MSAAKMTLTEARAWADKSSTSGYFQLGEQHGETTCARCHERVPFEREYRWRVVRKGQPYSRINATTKRGEVFDMETVRQSITRTLIEHYREGECQPR
jgi:cytochrome c553